MIMPWEYQDARDGGCRMPGMYRDTWPDGLGSFEMPGMVGCRKPRRFVPEGMPRDASWDARCPECRGAGCPVALNG